MNEYSIIICLAQNERIKNEELLYYWYLLFIYTSKPFKKDKVNGKFWFCYLTFEDIEYLYIKSVAKKLQVAVELKSFDERFREKKQTFLSFLLLQD